MNSELKKIFMQVEKPARYVGGEYNLPNMNKEHKVSFCLCFTDIYEVAMSNIGIAILYGILNAAPDVLCERCFTPWVDLGKILKEKKIPLMSIENQRPLKEFDVVGISVSYEMSYTNILYLLDLAQIPFRSVDRDDSFPLIVGGGPAGANPEPIIDFFDAFFIGDGEENDLAFCRLVEKYKGDKKKILEEAAKIDGIYVPSLCVFKDGRNVTSVKKAVVKDLNKAQFPAKPLVPNIEIVHDRGVIELYRGCYAGCRFCQACYFYRPIRYREKDTVISLAQSIVSNTGFDELSLSSLSTGDYDGIADVIGEIKKITDKENVVLQMPSMRLDSLTSDMISSAKKTSLTFAPEAGTQRLRNVINKNITDEDIDKSMRIAFNIGYNTVKLYFMMGLPTETDEDIMGIVDVVKKIKSIYSEVTHRKDIFINVSTALFIPKPVTPFQWCRQTSLEEMYAKQSILKAELYKIKGVHFSYHGAEISVLEGVFARGDRKLSYAIEDAYRLGCRFDGWSEMFNASLWKEALEANGIDPVFYVRERSEEEALPWDFIDFGVTKDYLLKEYRKAKSGLTTSPCKRECNGCGALSLGGCRKFCEVK